PSENARSRATNSTRSTALPLLVFLSLILTYVVLLTTFGRLMQSDDEVFYKAAGREWAATGRFGAPELVKVWNSNTEVADVYFLFTPLYTFLFGLFVKLVGFGWRTCVFYDAAIAAILAGLTFWAVDLATDRRNRWIAALGGLAVLPLTNNGRPDALATCFGMFSLILLWSGAPTAKRLITSGVALGLCAGTSPSAALLLGVIGLTRIAWWRLPLQVRVGQALVWGLIAFATFGLVVAPIVVPHPSSVEQFSLGMQRTVVARG